MTWPALIYWTAACAVLLLLYGIVVERLMP